MGYSPSFVANFNDIALRLNAGSSLEVVSGADDICAALQRDGAGLCPHSDVCTGSLIDFRDRAALETLSTFFTDGELALGAMVSLTSAKVGELREAFGAKKIRRPCIGCSWFHDCSIIAAANYTGVALMPDSLG